VPPTSPRRVTLQHVADRAGVSIATASRALAGAVASAASSERVLAAASELGYIPNESARSLRAERTMTIGVAFFSLKLPGGLDMLEGLSRAFDESGHTLLIADTGGNRSRFDTILSRFLERRVDALVCVNPDGVGPVLERYSEGGIPAVALISRGKGASGLPLISPSLEPAAGEVLRRLERLGHRRIALMLPGGEAGAFRSIWRLLRTTPLEATSIDPFAPAFSIRKAAESFREVSGPTAVLTTYPFALQLLRECRELRIAVPRGLSIAAINDEPMLSEMLETPLSAINVDMAAFGRAAGKLVLDWLAGTPPARTTLVPVSNWIDRATVGPPRAL